MLIGEATPGGRIVAIEACRILRLHAVVLQDLSRDYPEILLEICRDLARRLRTVEGSDVGGGPIPPLEALSS